MVWKFPILEISSGFYLHLSLQKKRQSWVFAAYFSYSEYAEMVLKITTHFKTKSLVLLARGSQIVRLLTKL